MNKFVKIFAAATLALSLSACGKSSEEKAQDDAQKLTQEQNALVGQLNASTPSSSWTDSQLNDYLGKLNRLEQVESALYAHDGNNGVMVFGSPNRTFISQRRQLISSIKSSRNLNPQPGNTVAVPGQTVVVTPSQTIDEAIDTFNTSHRWERARMNEIVGDMLSIEHMQNHAKVSQNLDKAKQILASIERRQVILNTHRSQIEAAYSQQSQLDTERRAIQDLIKSLEGLIEETSAANPSPTEVHTGTSNISTAYHDYMALKTQTQKDIDTLATAMQDRAGFSNLELVRSWHLQAKQILESIKKREAILKEFPGRFGAPEYQQRDIDLQKQRLEDTIMSLEEITAQLTPRATA